MRPNAREAAFDIIRRVVKSGAGWDKALNDSKPFNALEGRERGFAFHLAAGTLRHYNLAKRVLRNLSGRPRLKPPEIEVLCALGIVQILFMDVPAHAAVNETVNLAPQPQRGLVNALLRRAEREKDEILKKLDIARYALPKALYERLVEDYGEKEARAVALFCLQEPALDITVKGDAPRWAEMLGGKMHEFGSVRLTEFGNVAGLSGFVEGEWWVQDAAASLPVRTLGDVAGKRVLDMCAAPGGKTLQLAAAGAKVVAVDLSEHRLDTAYENAERCGLLDRISFMVGDACTYDDPEPFDVVVVDAPCSASGTLRRHPDMWVEDKPRDIEGLIKLQDAMLDRAANLVKPGGTLLLITCSLDKREGEDRAESFQKRHLGFQRLTDPQQSRILPHKFATDGFFFCGFAQES